MRILLIGSGNVAHHFFLQWKTKHIVDILHRNNLSESDWNGINHSYQKMEPAKEYDFTLIAVKDDAIEEILNQYSISTRFIAHTSGSVEMNIFKNKGYNNYGVFYPLQTFTKGRVLAFEEIPFIIEGNSDEAIEFLKQLTKELGAAYYMLNSEEKRQLHMAAVWVCNYTNYMRMVGKKHVVDEHFQLLHPLMKETLIKSLDLGVEKAQTGPAKRQDHATIEKHLQLLNGEEKELYALIAKMIMNDEKL